MHNYKTDCRYSSLKMRFDQEENYMSPEHTHSSNSLYIKMWISLGSEKQIIIYTLYILWGKISYKVNLLKQKQCNLEQKDHLFFNIWELLNIFKLMANNSRNVQALEMENSKFGHPNVCGNLLLINNKPYAFLI